MHFSQLSFLTASLAATTLAIDARLYFSVTSKCDPNLNYARCIDLAPDTCCNKWIDGPGNYFYSASIDAIPDGWAIDGRAHRGKNCAETLMAKRNNGKPTICMWRDITTLSGAGYGFTQFRRAASGEAEEKPCQEPTSLVFADGQEYDLANASEEHVHEIFRIAAAGGNSTEVPTHFDRYRK